MDDFERDASNAAPGAGGGERPALVEITLYVNGESPASRRALENVRAVAEAARDAEVSLEVIDLALDRAAAERDGVIAVPMLIKRGAGRAARYVGSFADRAVLAELLGLD